jgi:transcriptional regulator with XRE-family HTH domain
MDTEQLIQIRKRLAATQEVMADYLQCDAVGYQRYENGTRKIPRYIARSAITLDFLLKQKLIKKFEAFISSDTTT